MDELHTIKEREGRWRMIDKARKKQAEALAEGRLRQVKIKRKRVQLNDKWYKRAMPYKTILYKCMALKYKI